MTDAYQVYLGWDEESNLATILPQPATPGGVGVDAVWNCEQGANAQGYLRTALTWRGRGDGAITRAQYNAILTQFGLSNSVLTTDVTVRIRANDNSFENWNATATYLPGSARRNMAFWDDLDITLILLELIPDP